MLFEMHTQKASTQISLRGPRRLTLFDTILLLVNFLRVKEPYDLRILLVDKIECRMKRAKTCIALRLHRYTSQTG